MRHDVPIFLPLSSPFSSTASTSVSVTPRIWAASFGLRSSGAAVAGCGNARCRRAAEPLLHHLLREAEAHGQLGGRAGRAGAASRREALPHLVLHVVVEVADRRHAGALVDRFLDLGRHRHVLDDEAGDRQAVLRGDGLIDHRQQRLAQLAVARRDVEHRDLRRRDGVRKEADDARAHGVGELVEPEVVVGAGHLAQERLGLDDLEVVGAEGANPYHAEVGVTQHDGIGRAPLVAGEEPRDDVVDVGLERRVEAVLPRLQLGENRDVVGRQRVLARPEGVAELAEVDKLRHLRLAHDQLRAVLDRLVVIRKAVRKGVARVVRPLDDVDELALEKVGYAHSQR